jgi:hypothetical protein
MYLAVCQTTLSKKGFYFQKKLHKMHFLLLFALIVAGSPHRPTPLPWSLCGLAEEQGWEKHG